MLPRAGAFGAGTPLYAISNSNDDPTTGDRSATCHIGGHRGVPEQVPGGKFFTADNADYSDHSEGYAMLELGPLSFLNPKLSTTIRAIPEGVRGPLSLC